MKLRTWILLAVAGIGFGFFQEVIHNSEELKAETKHKLDSLEVEHQWKLDSIDYYYDHP